MLNDKHTLRQQFRARRKTLTIEERTLASRSLVQHILAQSWYKNKQNFAVYLAVNDEMDTTPLIDSLWQQQKTCYLPKITSDDTLLFAHYTADTVLQNNRFDIGEPDHSAPLYSADHLDVIFMPLVAFDLQGHRLGMGAGYYDKTLATIHSQKNCPLLVGLAYAIQQAPHIPHDTWDINLDIIVTEQGVHSCTIG